MQNQRYFNRELSWLEFNQRVLCEAENQSLPLLERLRFLSITASNLDEFFMVRVGSLSLLSRRHGAPPDPAGMTPTQQLEAISAASQRMMQRQYRCYVDDIEPNLAAEGIRRLRVDALNDRQAEVVEQIFDGEIFSVATPMAVTAEDEFPLLGNQTLHVCVRLAPAAEGAPDRFAILPLGRTIHRIITLPSDGGMAYLLVEDAVRQFAHRYFPGESVEECVAFRLTLNADFEMDDELAENLVREIQEVLDARKLAECVRLEVETDVTPATLQFLKDRLEIDDAAVYRPPGPLSLTGLTPLCDAAGYDHLRYEPWPPCRSPDIDDSDMFHVLSNKDVLLHHPYDSFEPVVRLIEQAADDPDVLAIKQTLYRTSSSSPIVAALRRAADNGKYVTVLVELKARFDEARNIHWARRLEQAGAQVIYGVRGLKTHAKVCVIVRREPYGIQRYIHFGTGNYNERTARLYTDISYMTSKEEFGADASRFFNSITGYSQPQQFHHIEAAPLGLRDRLIELIEGEAQRKSQGQKAQILAKMNSLVDPDIINSLYEASQAGVSIKLNVRGICCLRPGVPGLSDNILVVSIVDRLLEHSRVFSFHHGGDERVFISSADWMPRNLDRRVELLTPIEDAACRRKVTHILDACFRDNVKAKRLLPDGSYVPVDDPKGQPFRCQLRLHEQAREALARSEQSQRTMHVPHRPTDETP